MASRAGARRHWRWSAIAMLVAAGVLVAGCAGQEVSGSAQPTGDIDPGNVAGLPVTDGPSGLKPGVSKAGLTVQNGNGGAMDTLAVDSLSDIFQFWSTALPQDFGKQFTPVKKLVSYESNGPDVKVCGGEDSQGVENAFYCPVDDSVSWDRGTLLPMLNQAFGPIAVATVFAHEMGHAIQFRLGSVNQATPTIVKEQQADCYAGAFMRWVAEGNAPHLQLSTGPGLNAILATMIFIRDPVGSVSADTQAHGDAFDRVTAFQFGFTSGPIRCNKINNKEVQDRITELGFTSESKSSNNNVPVDDQTVQLLQQSLDATFKANTKNPPKITSGDGSCGSGTSTPPASFCPADDTINIDVTALNKIAQLPANDSLGVNGPSLGDFAAFGEIASRYALAVQKALGISTTDANAGLRTACLTGAWAGVTRHRFADGPQQQLLIGPGDLDEAVAELLGSHSLIAADANGNQVPAGFARVESFQMGFLQGSNACTTKFG